MSDNATPKRKYVRIDPKHLEYARRRFSEFASCATVRAELKAQGHEYPYNALFFHWKKANSGFGGQLAAAANKARAAA